MHALLLALALAAPPATLDEKIAATLKSHPDIKAAEAKKLLAEAELEQAKLAITQRVSAAVSKIELAKAKLMQAEEEAKVAEIALEAQKVGRLSALELAQFMKAKPALIGAKAELAAAESELQQLVGPAVSAERKPSGDGPLVLSTGTSEPKLPTGPAIEKLEAATKLMVSLDVKEVKIEAALASIIGADDVLIRGPKAMTNPITVKQKTPVTFAAAVELLTDEFNLANPGSTYQVYVREYGLLVELKGGVAPKDAVTLSEFVKAMRAKQK